MIAQILLEQFDRISDVPGAVSRLRRFVLDLAVRGKLVEQDPNDEPATELLKQLQKEQLRLLKDTKIRSARASVAVEDEDEPFPLPAQWVWCRLSQVGSIVGGATPPSSDLDNFTAGGSGIAWLTPADLGKHPGLYVSHGARDLTPEGLRSCSATLMPKGSVLFTSRAPIGYTAIAANEVSTNQGFKSVIPFIQACNLYIAVYFRAFGKRIDEKASGTTFREVSGKVVANLPFPLPPLAEQHRIVAKVDELLALCNRLERAQAEQERRRDRLAASSLHHLSGAYNESFREHARFYLSQFARLTVRSEEIPALRQTILNLALRGQLVAHDPRDEPASEILKQIDAERMQLIKAGKAKEQKQVRMTSPHDVPFEVPDGWCWVSLGQIAYGFRYGSSVKCGYEQTGEPVLRIPNIQNGRVTTENLKFGPLSKQEAQDLRLQLGDILMVRSNGSLDLVGRAALVERDTVGYCYAGYLVRVRTSVKYLDTRYLLLALSTTHIRNQIEVPIRTTVGLKNVNAAELSRLAIPLAPLAAQHRIVAKVDELMTLCDRLQAQLESTRSESHCLLEAVLDQALNGNREQIHAVENS